MKREAITHTKMKRLCRRLDLPLWQGVGLLESLWHLTARETPRGNIGKLSDEDIALGIDYRGSESDLVTALVESGWCDRDPNERLIIHDWADHADDAVHARIARMREFFADGHRPKTTKLTGDERRAAIEFYEAAADRGHSAAETMTTAAEANKQKPIGGTAAEFGSLPEPEPEPEPNTLSAAETAAACDPTAETFDLSDEARAEAWSNTNRAPKKSRLTPELETVLEEVSRRIHERHPAVRRCGIGVVKAQLKAIARRVAPAARVDLLHRVEQNHAAWCAWPGWCNDDGLYAKGLENWLAPTKERWNEPPPVAGGVDPEPPRLMM
jgi:hypothetical protein